MAEPGRFKRTDAQLAVARLYGFTSWNRLRAELDLIAQFARPDPADRDLAQHATPVDVFVGLACVSYGDEDAHARLRRARAVLEGDPDLAAGSIPAMAVTGLHEPLAQAVREAPEQANTPCGPNQWPPLLYCTYSRITDQPPGRSALRTAEVLLAAGADPNAGFLWRGLVPPFTALTGALGRGEQDQPPHPQAVDLARLLLNAGADPNDGQALYNNGLAGTAHDDPTHLRLLVNHGLGAPSDGPWYQRFGDRLTPESELLYDELEVAAHRGLAQRMAFLVSLDLDLDRPVGRSGQRPLTLAMNRAMRSILIAAGATAALQVGCLESCVELMRGAELA